MSSKYISGYRAQTRSRAIRYTVSITVLIIVLAILQVTVFSKLRLFGAIPDLMICAVLCLSFFFGRYAGAVTGIGTGFLIEALGSTGFSLLPVVYLLCGYIAGHYAKSVIPKKYHVYLIYLFLILLVRGTVTLVYTCLTYREIHLPQILMQTVFPEMGATAILGCFLYFPIMLFCRIIDQKK